MSVNRKIIVIGGGISGLTAALILRAKVVEGKEYPGGLLASFNVDIMSNKKEFAYIREETKAFFDRSGHWAWALEYSGYAKDILMKYATFNRFERKSNVYLIDLDVIIPYPIQSNISYLPKELRDIVEEELKCPKNINPQQLHQYTFDRVLRELFGETLYKIFFEPYNDMYTDGLLYVVAPPRSIKIPSLETSQYREGARGYNPVLYYPEIGWGPLMAKLSREVKLSLNSRVTYIDPKKRKIVVNDNTSLDYDILLSSMPLNKIIEIVDSDDLKDLRNKQNPYTGVLIINAIAKQGTLKHNYHWIYLSKTKSRFHRIGYYTNVSEWFLPQNLRKKGYVSIYIERVFHPSNVPKKFDNLVQSILNEAQELGLIGEPIYFDYEYIEVAYTWKYPNSKWDREVINSLLNYNIIAIGRYSTWGMIEGIVECVEYVASLAKKNWNSLRSNNL